MFGLVGHSAKGSHLISDKMDLAFPSINCFGAPESLVGNLYQSKMSLCFSTSNMALQKLNHALVQMDYILIKL